MYFDAFTISALVDEFMDTIVGGRVQDVIDVDAMGIGLEIYNNRKRHYLYMSADTQTPRVHIVPEKLRRGLPKPTQIGLLMRNYVEGGVVAHVSQPEWERILHIDVEGAKGEVTIIIEPMERRSNILLVQDGVILDCVRRIGPEENRYRLSLPKHEYTPPPPMTGRFNPFTITYEELEAIFEQNTDAKRKVFQVLSSRLYGFSPLLAKEVVFRASGEIKQKAPEADIDALYEKLKEVVEPLKNREWQPGFAESDDEVVAFSVYLLQSMGNWEETETVSEAASAYYGVAVGIEAYDEAKKPVKASIQDAMGRLRGKLASLEDGLKDDTEKEQLRQSGELILAYQYSLQDGQTELCAQYEADALELVIKLDPQLSALDNAQRYFDRYNKAKRAQQGVPQLIEETKNELNYLAQLESDLEMATNWPEIDDVVQALLSRGHIQKKVKRIGGGGRTGPMKLTQDGYVIWVGRNSRQNEQVTFKNANSQDLWLHARDVPGAHVVIRNDGRRIPEDLIERAAAVAAFYSSNRGEGNVIVDVTRVKYVKKIKGAGPGMVTYRNEETVTVQPQNEEILKNG